jgi:hypothetical protein
VSVCIALLQARPQPIAIGRPSTPAITFVDATQTAGLASWRHVSGEAGKKYLIESTGSGVALWDYDQDGRLDIYLVNGSTLDTVRRGGQAPAAALFRNLGDGTFADVTGRAGVANGRWGQGVCAGDVDNDGRQDLYVTNYGTNRLYRQSADGVFGDVAATAGVAVAGWSTGCAFADFDRDGWLDLYVAGYVSLDPARLPPAPFDATSAVQPAPGTVGDGAPRTSDGRLGLGAALAAGAASCTYRGVPVMCGPAGLTGAPDHLFRNNGDGTFRDVTREAGVEDVRRRYGFGVAWFDMDDDGWLDLLVANDSGPNHVYRNLGNGKFEDVSYLSGAALDGNGRSQAHMGIAIGDYDNDGRDDIHITNFADDFNVLYRNHDGATFSDVSYAAGVAQPSVPFLGWGTEFLDYDNDGWKDLLVVNGHVYPQADRLPWNTSYAQRALLFRNVRGSRFEEVGAQAGPALAVPRVSRGAAVGDIDNDGDIDFAVNQLDGPPLLAVNDGGAAAGHWLVVRLRGDPVQKTPRDAIGSTVFVTAAGLRRRAEVASGRGQVSQSDLRAHVGLGTATQIEALDVRWANGVTTRYPVSRVDTVVTIDQETGAVSYDRQPE